MGEVGDYSWTLSDLSRRVLKLREYPWLDQTRCFDADIYDSGWNPLICDMMRELDAVLAGVDVQFQLRQIKEKLGYLRCYYRLPGASDELRQAVAKVYEHAVERSGQTCIECAAPASVASHRGWIGPLCPRHTGKGSR